MAKFYNEEHDFPPATLAEIRRVAEAERELKAARDLRDRLREGFYSDDGPCPYPDSHHSSCRCGGMAGDR